MLPTEIPTHWNVKGEVDGTTSVIPGLFFLPGMMAGITLLMIFLPRIDPKKEVYAGFQKAYDGLILLINLFFLVLFIVTILWALGIQIPMNQVMSVLFAILMGGIAFFIRDVQPNWFAGIRTPWTMENETVWKETHLRGFRVFIIIAIFCLLGVVIPDYAYLFILLPVIFGTLYLFVYSYMIWQKENQT
ncbi:MAG: DUF1648 domain-containing protein [Methanomicrobiales archaeon]|nr:DUF1648 domain-containing protein [Methanomicrobiales archaeon]